MTPAPATSVGEALSAEELWEVWPVLSPEERTEAFRLLDPEEADDFYLSLTPLGQAQIIERLPPGQRRLWMRLLPPDDAADVLQEVGPESRAPLIALLDQATRREVNALLAYAEDDAGGLMSPRFARIRPDMTVDEAIRYLRRQARDRLEMIYYAYVLDAAQHLLGVISFRELFRAPGDRPVSEVMNRDVVSVPEDMDQEKVSHVISQYDFMALPVIDSEGRMKGIVTLDDIVDVVQEEATEDVHKFGGLEALEDPYLQTTFGTLIKKRAGWLSLLFLSEMLTATAMSHYQHEIATAVVLTIFLPLIISSGGNSGSQAATLVIRAMALGEVRLRDWWLIMRREVFTGLTLGLILAVIGLARILSWHVMFGSYGAYYFLVALTVSCSLVGVVLWGSLAGSMLPFVIRRLGFDPAGASSPFVATLVDVSGLIIYFSVARVVLGGTLL